MATLPNWRELQITDKQDRFIRSLINNGAPDFSGTTRGDAWDYINDNIMFKYRTEYLDYDGYIESMFDISDFC